MKTTVDKCLKIFNIVRKEIRECDNLYTLCKNIVQNLNNEYGKRWHCNVNYDSLSESNFNYTIGDYISMSFGKLFLEIYKIEIVSVII